MSTKRNALIAGMLLILLFTSACGAAATSVPETRDPSDPSDPSGIYANATEAPATQASAYSPEVESPQHNGQPPSANSEVPESNREPYDMFFKDYGVNPSIDTEDDSLSTFALDVDTGSYTIMRNYLKDGNLPPSESVRVEEYINYFAQGYPNPQPHQAFGINIDGAPSPFTQSERYQMLRIGIQGYQVPAHERQDASLTFLI